MVLSFNTLLETVEFHLFNESDRPMLSDYRQPERVKHYTAGELKNWTDRVVQALYRHNFRSGDAVAVIAEREPVFVAGILGVLRAGGFYLPVNAEEHPERIRSILKDSNVRYVLTAERFQDSFSEFACCINAERLAAESAGHPTDDVCSGPSVLSGCGDAPETPLCRMYTSGTTGMPKGCDISKQAVFNLITGEKPYAHDASDVMLQAGSPSFDASTYEIWTALFWGSRLVFADKMALLSPDILKAVLKTAGVTCALITTALFHELIASDPTVFRSLRQVLIGGGTLHADAAANVISACPDTRFFNVYGPTENTVISTVYEIGPGDIGRARLPIGRVIGGVTAYVAGPSGEPVPPGTAGELYLGGAGLTFGYHSRADLNDEKFTVRDGCRYYKTGDRVRAIEPGMYEFLGRLDSQIKINGVRVELEELEVLLCRHPLVTSAAVIARSDLGFPQLTAFFSGPVSGKALARYLRTSLPDYMIPTVWFARSRLPITINGKLDRRKLGDEWACAQQLAQSWAEILGEIRCGQATVSDRPRRCLDSMQLMRFAERIGVGLFAFGDDPTILELAGSIGAADGRPAEQNTADSRKELDFSHMDGLWESLI